jgi:acetolactate synthase-1/2/3 large subunit
MLGPKRNGGNLLAELLHEYGFEYVFGVPSEAPEFVAPLWHQGKPRYIVLRDERAAPFAANVYTRLTGRLAAVEAAPSVGSLLMLPGLAESLNSCVPMLALFTDVSQMSGPRRERGIWNQSTNQVTIFKDVVKYCAVVPKVEKIPEFLAYALQVATSGRPGPVALIVPNDVLAADATDVPLGRIRPELATFPAARNGADSRAVEDAARTISQSTRPVLLAGGGAVLSNAGAEIVKFAESTGIPVATTLTGSGVIDEYHRLALGPAGFYGVDLASQALDHADTIVMVGAKGSGYSTWLWRYPRPEQKVIRLDLEAVDANNISYESQTLLGDAKTSLESLTEAIDRIRERPDLGVWASEVSVMRASWETKRKHLLATDDDSDRVASAKDIVRELDQRTGPGDVLIAEASAATGWSSLIRTKPGAQRIAFRGLGILGGTIGGSIGACLAQQPPRRVIQIAGDGAMGYQIGECVTLTRLGYKVISIVLNNSALGAVRIWPGMPQESAEIGTIDFAAAARACGWEGIRVDRVSELTSALDAAFNCTKSVLVDIAVDPDEWVELAFNNGRLVPAYDAGP